MFRIQKLLRREYTDFEETVLIESPFAQVTEHGIGIRQVQLALTATRLIIGTDVFDKCQSTPFNKIVSSQQDPEIETMRLKSLLPVDYLEIKAFRKGTRQVLRVRKSATKVMWFEFGGHVLKNMYWNIWRERISNLKALHNGIPQPYIGKSDSISWATTTSSEDDVPRQLVVRAQIHQQNSDLLSKNKLLEPSSRASDVSNKQTTSIGNCNLAIDTLSCDQEMIVRESGEYILESRSEIIIGQYTFGYEPCEGICRNFLFRSASVAAMAGYWDANCNKY